MDKQLINHVGTNIETINAWLGIHASLQFSDITKPIFEAYTIATGVNVESCNDCKLDALMWAKIEYKKTLNDKTDAKPKK